MMSRCLLAIALAAVALPAFAKKEPREPMECENNFTYSGSMSDGKTFKTSVVHTGMTYQQAYDKALAYLRNSDKRMVVDANVERGYIRAESRVFGGDSVPLRMLFNGRADGSVKVDVSLNAYSGQLVLKSAAMAETCNLVNSPAFADAS
jgi:hypothetical protein